MNFAVGNSDDDERQNILEKNTGHSVAKVWICRYMFTMCLEFIKCIPHSLILFDGVLIAIAPVFHANLDIRQRQLIGSGQWIFYGFLLIMKQFSIKEDSVICSSTIITSRESSLDFTNTGADRRLEMTRMTGRNISAPIGFIWTTISQTRAAIGELNGRRCLDLDSVL